MTAVTTGITAIGSTAIGAIAITAAGAIANLTVGEKEIPSGQFWRGFFRPTVRGGKPDQWRASAAFSGVEGVTAATGLNGATTGLLPAVLPKSGFRLPSMKAPDSILMS